MGQMALPTMSNIQLELISLATSDSAQPPRIHGRPERQFFPHYFPHDSQSSQLMQFRFYNEGGISLLLNANLHFLVSKTRKISALASL